MDETSGRPGFVTWPGSLRGTDWEVVCRTDSHRIAWSLIRDFTTSSVPSMTVGCSRCGSLANSIMSFNYVESAVWLDDLVDPPQAYGYPMCADHSDRMTPPQGWTLTDRRTVTRLFAPVHVA